MCNDPDPEAEAEEFCTDGLARLNADDGTVFVTCPPDVKDDADDDTILGGVLLQAEDSLLRPLIELLLPIKGNGTPPPALPIGGNVGGIKCAG